ncbi:MAG: SLC13 family permease [Oscillospiraceae bacterium]
MLRERLKEFWKKETVFCISFLLAAVSLLAVPVDRGYLAYPDYRTLALLFCLMMVVAGFQSLGIFTLLGKLLLRKAGSSRGISILLVLLCFFCSMIITNDVTLITFVPFTLLVFRMVHREERVLKIVVLETIAANLGSMATPIGNPQNIYLHSVSGMGMKAFLLAVLPYAGISLVLLLVALLVEKDEPLAGAADGLEDKSPGSQDGIAMRRMLTGAVPYLLLLLLSLLVVFRILPYGVALIATAVVVFVVNRRLYRSLDWFLLLTFLCFFIFIGNMKRIPEVSDFLMTVLEGRELWLGILVSQVISNVPAAILLSGFTDHFAPLLTGVNLGGLGTLIASLASLISFRFYAREYPDQKGKFLGVFTLWNVGFLLILMAAAVAIGRVL